jgi:autotransporter-associated beta strand protein
MANANAVGASSVDVEAPINSLIFSPGIGTFNLGGVSGSGSFALSDTNSNPIKLVLNSGGDFSGAMSGSAGSLNIVGGSEVLSGANSYTGPTTIFHGATLQIGAGGATGSLSANSAIIDNGALQFSRSNTMTQGNDFSGFSISGTGGIIQAGSGKVVLTSSNGFTGTTIVSSGTLQIGSGGASGSLPSGSAITDNGTLAFNRNSFSGGATVANGTLTILTSTALADGSALTVGNGSAFAAPVMPAPVVGASSAPAAIPEPATVSLLIVGALFLLIGRRRRS